MTLLCFLLNPILYLLVCGSFELKEGIFGDPMSEFLVFVINTFTFIVVAVGVCGLNSGPLAETKQENTSPGPELDPWKKVCIKVSDP